MMSGPTVFNRILLKTTNSGKIANFVLLLVVIGCIAAQQLFQKMDDVQIRILTIRVISGSEFDLTLIDKRRVHVELGVETTPDAKSKVVEMCSNSSHPRVILKKKESDHWIADLFFTLDESEINLTEWLKQKQLTYN